MSVQSIDRAIDILRVLASAGGQGARLIDLQRATGLSKPTVHRILETLRAQLFVEQDEASRRYRLGQELSILGLSATCHVYGLSGLAEEEMRSVASRSGDTSFLAVRSGHEIVCIDRQSGESAPAAVTWVVGERRPMGVGATGIALLAAQPAQEFAHTITLLDNSLSAYPKSILQNIENAVAEARKDGFAQSKGYAFSGVSGLAVTISDGAGHPLAAIGIASTSERIASQRKPDLVRMLRMHANRIEQRLIAAANRSRATTGRVIRLASRRG